MRWLIVVACGLVIACDRPITVVPTSAPTKGITVCWRGVDAGDVGTDRSLRTSLERRLVAAGYTPVPSGCTVALAWGWTTRSRNDESAFRTATMTLRRGDATLVDTIKLEFSQTDVPEHDTDLLATALVNAMNASSALAAVAKLPARGRSLIAVRGASMTIANGDGVITIDPDAIAAMPRGRVDVTIAQHAKWATVKQAFETLFLSNHGQLHIHAVETTFDVDIAAKAPWNDHETWLSLLIFPNFIEGNWRTAKACSDVPRSFHEKMALLDAVRGNLSTCTRCVDRLTIGGSSTDADNYLAAIAIAARASGALTLDFQNAVPPDPMCRADGTVPDAELEATFRHHYRDMYRCTDYVGPIKVALSVDAAGNATATAIEFSDKTKLVWDREKTCVAEVIAGMRLPPPGRNVDLTHSFPFANHNTSAPSKP